MRWLHFCRERHQLIDDQCPQFLVSVIIHHELCINCDAKSSAGFQGVFRGIAFKFYEINLSRELDLAVKKEPSLGVTFALRTLAGVRESPSA